MLCNVISGIILAVVLAPFGNDFIAPSNFEWAMLTINGAIVLPIAFVLLTIGPSLISAPEVSLFSLIETVLGPVWVWLGGYEPPPLTAVYGGALLITALIVHR
jgi:drug/metabolite transporter (DMT)-like permease